MKPNIFFYITIVFLLLAQIGFAQTPTYVNWSFQHEITEEGKLLLLFTADIEDQWYVYSQTVPEGGPIPTSFSFDNSDQWNFLPLAKEMNTSESSYINVYDEMFGMNITKYADQVVFVQESIMNPNEETITGFLEFMCCDDKQCLAPQIVNFTFNLK